MSSSSSDLTDISSGLQPHPRYATEENKSSFAAGIDIPAVCGMAAGILALGLALIGVLGWAGTFTGTTFCWTVIGVSAAITVLTAGVASPATIVTIVLGILGLTGTVPFATVGMATLITISAGLIIGFCLLSKCSDSD